MRTSQIDSANPRDDSPMPSPFPGMNPYLKQEDAWHDFRKRFIPLVAELLVAQLIPQYIVKIEERSSVHEFPEVDEERLSFVAIRDRDNRRLVTVIELLSPSNKESGSSREQYLAKRGVLFAGGQPGRDRTFAWRAAIARHRPAPLAPIRSWSEGPIGLGCRIFGRSASASRSRESRSAIPTPPRSSTSRRCSTASTTRRGMLTISIKVSPSPHSGPRMRSGPGRSFQPRCDRPASKITKAFGDTHWGHCRRLDRSRVLVVKPVGHSDFGAAFFRS